MWQQIMHGKQQDGGGTACMNQKLQEGYTVDQVSGTVIYWDKDGPDNGSYEQRRKNYNKIYNILK